jgi:hypothetical protein
MKTTLPQMIILSMVILGTLQIYLTSQCFYTIHSDLDLEQKKFNFSMHKNAPMNVTATIMTNQENQMHREINGTVLILTPIKDASKHLDAYFQRLEKFQYPKHLISLGFLEGDSSDDTHEKIQSIIETKKLQSIYRRVTILQKSMSNAKLSTAARHDQDAQLSRRSNMAMARNYLLSTALYDEQYVFWLDSDVQRIPVDIISMMMNAKKPIVVANCMFLQAEKERKRSYDLNSWAETPASLDFVKTKKNHQLLLEGYVGVETHRKQLDRLRSNEERDLVVELNGVGGTALMVEADIHRIGINFPAFVIDNAIETEGLCRFAERNGVKCYGMPNLEVWHA